MTPTRGRFSIAIASLVGRSYAQLQSALRLTLDPVEDLRPYLRMGVWSDENAEMLQANPTLVCIFADLKFFRAKRLADRADRIPSPPC